VTYSNGLDNGAGIGTPSNFSFNKTNSTSNVVDRNSTVYSELQTDIVSDGLGSAAAHNANTQSAPILSIPSAPPPPPLIIPRVPPAPPLLTRTRQPKSSGVNVGGSSDVEVRPIRVGKIQWPPPRAGADFKPEVQVGRLEIDEAAEAVNQTNESRPAAEIVRQKINERINAATGPAGPSVIHRTPSTNTPPSQVNCLPTHHQVR
jgi:hypothetical protein